MSSSLIISASVGEVREEGLASATANATISYSLQLSEGSGNGEIDGWWTALETIAAGGNLVVDLTALFDAYGLSLAFATIKKIVIVNCGELVDEAYVKAAGEDIQIGNAASNAFTAMFGSVATAVLDVKSGGAFVVAAGFAGWTVDSTHKNIKIHNSGSSDNDVKIIIEGVKV